jgi:phospholipid/cholesterol/gamma-HCH transport system substrate-binding protein
LKVLRYAANELAYNPPGNDEGMLFWLDWVAHDWNNIFTTGDAHGRIGRAELYVPCPQLATLGPLGRLLAGATGTINVCPGA